MRCTSAAACGLCGSGESAVAFSCAATCCGWFSRRLARTGVRSHRANYVRRKKSHLGLYPAVGAARSDHAATCASLAPSGSSSSSISSLSAHVSGRISAHRLPPSRFVVVASTCATRHRAFGQHSRSLPRVVQALRAAHWGILGQESTSARLSPSLCSSAGAPEAVVRTRR